MNKIKVVFMGTPEFAVPSLEMLVNNGVDVVAVVTAPDKPQGRGQKVLFSPVKECAVRHKIPVLQPKNLKSPEFVEQLEAFRADLQVVVAFRMLPETVWSMPPEGTFNLHASLLPQYRGAAPINWAVINGEKETGVTTFFLKHEIDTGSIIFQEKESISEDDTAGTLYQRLMHKGASLVLKTVNTIEAGGVNAVPQKEVTPVKHAPKIFKETCEVNWDQPATSVRNFVRGLCPYPGAWTAINGKTYKIYSGDVIMEGGERNSLHPGQYHTDNTSFLHFKTAEGYYAVSELQPEGKRRMYIGDFFRGNKLH
jgi:methionyl-tRNA formyltransferase